MRNKMKLTSACDVLSVLWITFIVTFSSYTIRTAHDDEMDDDSDRADGDRIMRLSFCNFIPRKI